MRETRLVDYLGFLQDLWLTGADYFLEEGQAVNFWAEYFSSRESNEVLRPFAPFTSKDCDIWASHTALLYLRENRNGGRLITGTSPADGQVGIFRIADNPEYVVDIMSNVYGIPMHQLDNVKARCLLLEGVRVIDPLFLFQSKCHCLLGLDQTGRQDERHVRMLSLIVPAHFEALLAEVIAGHLTERALIRELKFMQKILKQNQIKRALEQIKVRPTSFVPIDSLTTSNLSKVVQFAETGLRAG